MADTTHGRPADVLPPGFQLEDGEEPDFRTRLHHTNYQTWSLSLPYLSGENDEEREYVIEYGCRLDVAGAARTLAGALARVVAVLESQPDDEGVPARSRHSKPIPAGMDPIGELALARLLRLEWSSVRAAVNPDVHTPARTMAYLKARGWVKDHDRRGGEDWHDQPDRDGKMRFAFVPLDATFVDWDKRMAELVRDLADAYGTGELGVLAAIAEATDG